MRWINCDNVPDQKGEYIIRLVDPQTDEEKKYGAAVNGNWLSPTGLWHWYNIPPENYHKYEWLYEKEWTLIAEDYPPVELNGCSIDVLCLTRYGKMKIGFYEKGVCKWWETGDDEHQIEYVTYWRELPLKPKA